MTFTTATAQQYFYKTVDFTDSTGREYIHQVEPLGAILLKGYLDGQLKAYQFGVKSVDVKWKPLEPQAIPYEWDPGVGDYYVDDRVTYKGKFYLAEHDSRAVLENAPPNTEFWKEFEILGEPVSTIHSWPTAKDTTSKAELLESLVEYKETELDRVWLTAEDMGWGYYNGGDVVAYKGKYYECQMDHRPSQRGPDVDAENWLPAKPRVTFHLPTDEMTFAGVYYWKDSTGAMIPQVLSVECPSYNRFFPRNAGLNFYYSDVVNYLASLPRLPLLYHSNLGYMGTPQLMRDRDNTSKLLKLMQKGMNGALKPSKKDIIDATKYNSFLQAGEQELSSGKWSILQDMITNDVLVTTLETSHRTLEEDASSFHFHTPVVKISWKALEKVLITELAPLGPPRQWNYLEWINDYTSRYEREPEPIDSLEAKVRQHIAIPVPVRASFLEERLALWKDNSVMSESLGSLWIALKRAVNTKQLNLTTRESRFFRADKPFSEVTFKTSVAEWTLDKGFQLESEHALVMDSASMVHAPVGIRVVYKRQVTAQKSKTPLFEPIKLAMVVLDPKSGEYRNTYYLWEDVVKVEGLPPDVRKLLVVVMQGSLRFDDAELIYGLVGEK